MRDMSTENITTRVAGNVRAAMAERMVQISDLAKVIDTTPTTAGRRLRGEQPFTLADLGNIGDWLGYDPSEFSSSRFFIRPAALAA